MRKEFTAISAFSMAISFVAAIVLCVQIAQFKPSSEWQISGPTLWVLEVAVSGTAVYAWRNNVSLSGWLLGILAIVAVRLMISTAAGLGMAALHGDADFRDALQKMALLAPRVSAMGFSLMVFYPLRAFLPMRPPRAKPDRRRYAADGAAEGGNSDQPVVLVTGNERATVWEEKKPAQPAPRQTEVRLPTASIDGSIELPIPAVLAQVPHELIGDRARHYDDSSFVSIPLEVIVPQLREAEVSVAVADLARWLPSGVVKAPRADAAEEPLSVPLPLELVVPRLPPGVLALPEPSPPKWAELDVPDSITFATT